MQHAPRKKEDLREQPQEGSAGPAVERASKRSFLKGLRQLMLSRGIHGPMRRLEVDPELLRDALGLFFG